MAKTGSHLKIVPFGDAVLGVKLEGNPKKPEPEYFRVMFPGGDVDIVRCTDGTYWIHVRAEHQDSNAYDQESPPGVFDDARLDILGKHASDSNLGDFANEKLYHVAVHVKTVPRKKGK